MDKVDYPLASVAIDLLSNPNDDNWTLRAQSFACQTTFKRFFRDIQLGIHKLIRYLAQPDPSRGSMNNCFFYTRFPEIALYKKLALSEVFATFSVQVYHDEQCKVLWTMFTGQETAPPLEVDPSDQFVQKLDLQVDYAKYHILFPMN